MHESPHFLAGKGRTEEAHRVLADVALANGAAKPDDGVKITSNVLCGNSVKDTVAALGDSAVRGRLVVMASSWFALSFGFYGFSVWGPSYFAARGFQRTGVYQAITLSVVCQLPGTSSSSSPLSSPPSNSAGYEYFMAAHNHFSTGTAVAALLVERVGRRLLLIAFSIGCTIAVSGVALFTSNAVIFADLPPFSPFAFDTHNQPCSIVFECSSLPLGRARLSRHLLALDSKHHKPLNSLCSANLSHPLNPQS